MPEDMSMLSWDLLLCAYAGGLFPMANDRDDPTIHWIDPRRRGVIPLDGFHVPRSLRKVIRRGLFTITIDTDFPTVIRACAESRLGRERTWLNGELITLYEEVHRRGFAHSVECWLGSRLVGGLYGVSLAGAFFGESMFSRERDASKVALVTLVERLTAGGYKLLDTQFITDHLRQFGATEITRAAYRRLLAAALGVSASFQSEGGAMRSSTPWLSGDGGGAVGSSQSTTQTS
jgi:leucyl/phenylalanyl-tRNA--protein transferase